MLSRRRVGAAREPAERTVLRRGVGDFRLAYFGATPTDAEPKWQERWEGWRYAPRLVRVTLDAGDGLARPPLVVRLWTAPD